jgi:hypothetical protein
MTWGLGLGAYDVGPWVRRTSGQLNDSRMAFHFRLLQGVDRIEDHKYAQKHSKPAPSPDH